MAWTAPMTAVANTAFTAAQFNLYVRDNLNTTPAALATAGGRIFVSTGVNAIAERVPTVNEVVNLESTTSTTYTNLTTAGPAVTVTTGTAAIYIISTAAYNETGGQFAAAAVAISGSTTVAASDSNGLLFRSDSAQQDVRMSVVQYVSGLTAGSNTFTMQYRCAGGTAAFQRRHLLVIPL